jgi:Type VI secretion system/phage-baseplate injector OB domain
MTLPNRAPSLGGTNVSQPRGATKISGVVLGTVISNLDPVNNGRVQVSIPVVGSTPWAPAIGSTDPDDDAWYEIGDTVVVAFQQGDPTFPVVLGRLGG